ncbi:hypothetical protein TorRG33x02_099060 [Trema orientale]|uniref:Uncharacterized protein n=1 Tax=Trema orientale TaxID=63057 RepID=A0A2P5F9G6_TREOI|nr:hypothetical protein TorRG33x02_099060 [Trema orientale]
MLEPFKPSRTEPIMNLLQPSLTVEPNRSTPHTPNIFPFIGGSLVRSVGRERKLERERERDESAISRERKSLGLSRV